VLDAVLRAVTTTGGSRTDQAGRRAPRTPASRGTGATSGRSSSVRSAQGRASADVTRARPGSPGTGAPPRGAPAAPAPGRASADFIGRVRVQYSPDPDGRPDPGEIVWTWVPYEDDPARGKDRPVLLVGRDGSHLLGLMLTSKDHTRDAADEARWGRVWLDIGAGEWDSQRRPSELRLDRVLRVDTDVAMALAASWKPLV
jgi:hypothetical protein